MWRMSMWCTHGASHLPFASANHIISESICRYSVDAACYDHSFIHTTPEPFVSPKSVIASISRISTPATWRQVCHVGE